MSGSVSRYCSCEPAAAHPVLSPASQATWPGRHGGAGRAGGFGLRGGGGAPWGVLGGVRRRVLGG